MIILSWNKDLKPENVMLKLLALRSLSFSFMDSLPDCGFIICQDDETPIAAGFLRKVEGGFGILDSYITNPKVHSAIRHLGLASLTTRLIDEAMSLKMRQVFAWSIHPEIIKRACDHGFEQSNHHFAILNLKGE